MGEGKLARAVKNEEVQAGQIIGDASSTPGAALGFELVDESTVVKKRPRDPARMQLRAMAMARCILPVPVPPNRTTLRCWAMKPPP